MKETILVTGHRAASGQWRHATSPLRSGHRPYRTPGGIPCHFHADGPGVDNLLVWFLGMITFFAAHPEHSIIAILELTGRLMQVAQARLLLHPA